MKINMTSPILDLAGEPIPGMTLRSAAIRALLEPLRGDESMQGERKAKLYVIAMRIHSEDEPDLDLGDVKEIRDRIDLAFPPLVVGRARELLDPKPKAAAEPTPATA